MNTTSAALDQVVDDLRSVLDGSAVAGLSDADRAGLLMRMGEVTRLAEAVVVEAVATADPEFGHGFGCRGMNELLQRALLTDASSASKIVKAASAVRRDVSLVSGERLPARWPRLRDALLDGRIGVAGVLAATGALENARDRIGTDERLRADESLARFALGYPLADADADADADAAEGGVEGGGSNGEVAGPPATPDDLRQAAQYLAMVLDPDGAEPTEQEALNRRFVNVGRLRNGVHPISGNLTADAAAQLRMILDAFGNPKVGGAPAPAVAFTETLDEVEDPFNTDPRNVIDPRSPGQKRHDALAAALGIAARHEDMPSLGGAAPTLVVHVDAADLAAGTGWATLPGAEAPVPLSVARHTACTGAVQRVLFDEGRIIGISTTDRVFTAHQRRAIVLRDGECLIPGCHVPASWCEIHHVTEHSRGGPTHTDNGVPLCWWHHRSLDTSGWEIRMANGIPQIRGPEWWDPDQHWRTPSPRLRLPAHATA